MNLRMFNIYYPVRNIALFLIEIILIFFAILTASIVKLSLLQGRSFSLWEVFPKILLVTIVCVLSLYYHDFYNFDNLSQERKMKELVLRALQTVGVASLALAFIYAIFPSWIVAKTVVMLSMLFVISLVLAMRLLYYWALQKNKLTERVLVLGVNDFALNIIDEIETKPDKGFRVVGILKDGQCSDFSINGIPVLGEVDDVLEVTKKIPCDRIVVSMLDQRRKLPLPRLLELKLTGKKINDGVEFYEHLTGKIMVGRLRPSYFIFSNGFKINKTRQLMKRTVDIVCSLLGLALSLPISVLIVIAIKLDTKGPVLYRQERVGHGGKIFTLYKFRSMHADAEKDQPIWAEVNDIRVTRVGRFIRKMRFDEIPQMFNVLKGDMSFVGPRPERTYFVNQLKEKIPYYIQRHAVKPGITGWAQIKYRYGASTEDALEKLKYDLYYAKNMSPLLDLTIIFETTKSFLLGAR
jgi:sugar transferase (PEP-CTERM system associated)